MRCAGRAGAGPGIERFRPRRGKLEISKNMVIENLACVLDLPPETLEAVAGTPAAAAGADAAAARTAWRPWTVEEMEAGEREPTPLGPMQALYCLGFRASFCLAPLEWVHMQAPALLASRAALLYGVTGLPGCCRGRGRAAAWRRDLLAG